MHNASIPDYFYLFSFTYCIFPDVSVFILSKPPSTGLYPWLLEFLTLGSMPPRSRRMEVLSYLCLEVSLHTASASGKKSRQGDKHWTQDYLVLSLGLLIPCVCHRARLTLHVSCISPWQQGLGLGLVYSLWYHNAQQHVPRKCRHSLYVGGVNEWVSVCFSVKAQATHWRTPRALIGAQVALNPLRTVTWSPVVIWQGTGAAEGFRGGVLDEMHISTDV